MATLDDMTPLADPHPRQGGHRRADTGPEPARPGGRAVLRTTSATVRPARPRACTCTRGFNTWSTIHDADIVAQVKTTTENGRSYVWVKRHATSSAATRAARSSWRSARRRRRDPMGTDLSPKPSRCLNHQLARNRAPLGSHPARGAGRERGRAQRVVELPAHLAVWWSAAARSRAPELTTRLPSGLNAAPGASPRRTRSSRGSRRPTLSHNRTVPSLPALTRRLVGPDRTRPCSPRPYGRTTRRGRRRRRPRSARCRRTPQRRCAWLSGVEGHIDDRSAGRQRPQQTLAVSGAPVRICCPPRRRSTSLPSGLKASAVTSPAVDLQLHPRPPVDGSPRCVARPRTRTRRARPSRRRRRRTSACSGSDTTSHDRRRATSHRRT